MRVKKHIIKFTVALSAFLIGILAIWFLWGKQPAGLILLSLKGNTFEENGPYSVLEGKTVVTYPFKVTFDLPEDWVVSKYGKNLFLSRQELKHVYMSRRFEGEESKVIDSVLDFNDCAAHFGEKEWDVGVVSDQARMYLVNQSSEEVQSLVSRSGLSAAEWVFDKASLKSSKVGEWQKSTINYVHAPTHALTIRDIDFYSRSYAGKTVVFVFIHSVGGDKFVQPVLDSLRERPL